MPDDEDAIITRIGQIHDLILARVNEGDNSPPVEIFAALVCNNCGRRLVAKDSIHLAARAHVEGWSVGERFGDADLCRGCSS